MMYWLFREHHWSPSAYAEMLPGTRKVVRAFCLKEIEDRKKEAEEIKKEMEKDKRSGQPNHIRPFDKRSGSKPENTVMDAIKNRFFIQEFDFCFCGMHINIYCVCRNIEV